MSGRSRGAAASRAVERWAGDNAGGLGLGSVGVDIEVDTGVAVAVSTREGDELSSGGSEASSTSNLDLSALRVKLL